MARILFVVNNPSFFLSHRVRIALAAQEAGYDVHVATMPGNSVQTIKAYGYPFLQIKKSFKNLLTVYSLSPRID